MKPVRLITESTDVDERLRDFDLTKADVLEIARAVAAARGDVTAADAVTAAGQQAYLAGVRHLNLVLMPKGWERKREDGIESIVHLETGKCLVYQNVDLACSKMHGPKALSGKGPAADRMIEERQGQLFSADEAPEIQLTSSDLGGEGIWFLCVSVNDDQVRAELSLPTSVGSGNFKGFIERIFVVQDGDLDPFALDEGNDDVGPTDYDVPISRK